MFYALCPPPLLQRGLWACNALLPARVCQACRSCFMLCMSERSAAVKSGALGAWVPRLQVSDCPLQLGALLPGRAARPPARVSLVIVPSPGRRIWGQCRMRAVLAVAPPRPFKLLKTRTRTMKGSTDLVCFALGMVLCLPARTGGNGSGSAKALGARSWRRFDGHATDSYATLSSIDE